MGYLRGNEEVFQELIRNFKKKKKKKKMIESKSSVAANFCDAANQRWEEPNFLSPSRTSSNG
jgi:hypothetical protein